ncbi:aspartyl protease family protein [Xanthomonas theicola]|uniref:Peptidase A2 domain-containing protein n=1 Tax=Xanthomonas theicola TaxID=56464 RepID=A0A2S6ZBQ2_9XANT|nr:aspartyl protease family protein [Xanthomonas theicola]PPT85371.1 hypothetical protein XthCFBP4691_16330 [Xanthomonas theicola]QNH23712.1 hypothetical protein G4Q83_01540 [Xanthomonas theicola]
MIALSLVLAALLQPAATVALQQDDRGRPVIEAQINDKGPFAMVVDTAAQTSLLAPSLVQELALRPLEGDMTIIGAVGMQTAKIYPVERLNAGLFDERQLEMLALPNDSITSARGIIGMERFAGSKVLFDLTAGTLTIAPSSAAASGHATVAGTTDGNGMLHVPLRLDGVSVQALVDTGAGRSVGNLALLKALGLRQDDPRVKPAGEIRGTADAATAAWIVQLETVALGPVRFRDVPLLISDMGEAGTPSMLLGNDLLGVLQGYAVDFPRAELQIRLPAAPAPAKP